MTDFTLAPVQIDKDKLRFDIFKYASDAVTVLLHEKDKGGTGATGTAMSIVEWLLSYGIAVHVVDFADTQLDLEMAYKDVDGISVHRAEEETGGEEGCVLRAIAAAKPGEVVVVQFPATSTARIERVHRLLVHAQARADLNIHTSIIWTMDRDRDSRDLLEATLNSPLPGPLPCQLANITPITDCFCSIHAIYSVRMAALVGFPCELALAATSLIFQNVLPVFLRSNCV